jgi:adenylate cyclase
LKGFTSGCLATFAALVVAGCAASPSSPRGDPHTAFVVIDDASISTIGAFPVDRSVYARAIQRAQELGARGVALKFFIESPRDEASDILLADSLLRGPVLMQVSSVQASTLVPQKLSRDGWNPHPGMQPLRMAGVTPPMPLLEARARGLGFVDAIDEKLDSTVEIVGRVGSHAVASLQLAIVELALGISAQLQANTLELGRKSLVLDDKGRVECHSMAREKPIAYGIGAFMDGGVERTDIQGRVVILGYGRSDSPQAIAGGRAVAAHELFYRQVACLAELASQGD